MLLFVTVKKCSKLFTHLIGTLYSLCRTKMFKISVLMLFNMQHLIDIFAQCDIFQNIKILTYLWKSNQNISDSVIQFFYQSREFKNV